MDDMGIRNPPKGQMFYWPFGEKLLAGVFFGCFADNELSYFDQDPVSMYFPAVGYGFGNACRYIHETLCDLHQMAKAFQGAYLDTSQGIGCQTKLTGSLDVLIYTHRMCIVQSFCHKSPYTTAAIVDFFGDPCPQNVWHFICIHSSLTSDILPDIHFWHRLGCLSPFEITSGFWICPFARSGSEAVQEEKTTTSRRFLWFVHTNLCICNPNLPTLAKQNVGLLGCKKIKEIVRHIG